MQKIFDKNARFIFLFFLPDYFPPIRPRVRFPPFSVPCLWPYPLLLCVCLGFVSAFRPIFFLSCWAYFSRTFYFSCSRLVAVRFSPAPIAVSSPLGIIPFFCPCFLCVAHATPSITFPRQGHHLPNAAYGRILYSFFCFAFPPSFFSSLCCTLLSMSFIDPPPLPLCLHPLFQCVADFFPFTVPCPALA